MVVMALHGPSEMGQLAWELNQDNALLERFAAADRYWQACDDESLWP